ncbi:hypothetical protein [Oryzifoliimicrobium ureilyticus]|uniref:hypothetical protein n=1 Tax=Oryzifoliimicrobium ureilyticus TaxID=3113724 RepID=UPI0030765B07
MSTERREYESRPADGGRKAPRSVKLPGEARHGSTAEPAASIARRLAMAKRERKMKERLDG